MNEGTLYIVIYYDTVNMIFYTLKLFFTNYRNDIYNRIFLIKPFIKFQVNIIGLTICTREAVKQMREKGANDGHVFLLNRLVIKYVYLTISLETFTQQQF